MEDNFTRTVDGARAFAEGSSLAYDRDNFDDFSEDTPESERVYDCNDCDSSYKNPNACFECPGMDT